VNIDSFISRFSGMTESYKFYNGEVELCYYPKEHEYFLLKDGEFILQDGVTKVVHIIDKSEALIPWGCKMMAEKIIKNAPVIDLPTGEKIVQLPVEAFEKLIVEGKSAHKENLKEASDIGKMAHDWIEQYIKAVLSDNEERKLELLAKFPNNEKARNCCIAALDWMQKHNVRWVCTEHKIYSRKHQYAGTMDGLCKVDSCDDTLCCPNHFKDRLSIVDWKSSNKLYIEYLYQTAAYQAAYSEEFGTDIHDRWVIRLGKDNGDFDPWHVEADEFDQDFEGFLTALKLTRSVRNVKERMKVRMDLIKTELKHRDKQEKEEAMRIRCPKADYYKGNRKSKCLEDGTQCDACRDIYEQKQYAKLAPQNI